MDNCRGPCKTRSNWRYFRTPVSLTEKLPFPTKFFLLVTIYPDSIIFSPRYFIGLIMVIKASIQSDADCSLDWNRSVVNREENDLSGCKTVIPMAAAGSTWARLQRAYTLWSSMATLVYWNGAQFAFNLVIKSTEQQPKILFNYYWIASGVYFEYLPLVIKCTFS